jgi:DNA (cytosine-5)-methyltransferase 1
MRSLELFAGCGGLALGVARAGFKHDLLIERDVDSVRTLNANKRRKLPHVREWKISEQDARVVNFSRHEGIDLLSGGPPCQPFSIGGKHLGPRDPRNMWPEAIRAVREVRPKAFIFENVRGLLRPDFARYLEYITLQLAYPQVSPKLEEKWRDHFRRLRCHAERPNARVKYRVIARAINAADYGAPQKRYRSIFIGVASEFGTDWEFPEPTHSQEALAWAKHVEGDYWARHGVRPIRTPSSDTEMWALRKIRQTDTKPKEHPWVTVRDAIGNLPTPTKREKVLGHWQHEGARSYPKHTGSNLDEPAKALKAGDHGVPGGENMLASRLGNVRYFTVREMARLQGFPDDFAIEGTWKAATRQLGNAVPISIGERMAGFVLNLIGSAAR